MKYQFVEVAKSGKPFSCICDGGCNTRMQSDRWLIWADLNGQAYRAYYCNHCKVRLEALEKAA